jgi:hypothetical protein
MMMGIGHLRPSASMVSSGAGGAGKFMPGALPLSC